MVEHDLRDGKRRVTLKKGPRSKKKVAECGESASDNDDASEEE